MTSSTSPELREQVGRLSIHIEGMGHAASPIPAAAVIGNMLMTSGVSGRDPLTGAISNELAEQVRGLFSNLRRILETAGGSADDVLKCTFFVRDRALCRKAIDVEWTEMFPDPTARPARHTLAYELPGGIDVQCELVAILDRQRQP